MSAGALAHDSAAPFAISNGGLLPALFSPSSSPVAHVFASHLGLQVIQPNGLSFVHGPRCRFFDECVCVYLPYLDLFFPDDPSFSVESPPFFSHFYRRRFSSSSVQLFPFLQFLSPPFSIPALCLLFFWSSLFFPPYHNKSIYKFKLIPSSLRPP